MVIKKIFENDFDEEIHSAFLKFSRGEFKNRYLIEVKKQKDKWAIKTSAEFANFLVKKCLEKGGNEKIPMKGIIVSTLNLGDDELGFEIKKRSNFQGIRKLQIDTEIYPRKILDLMEKYPRVFFALSFATLDCQLKIKPKAPKSGKPGKKDGEGPKVDFCSLKTKDNEIIRNLLFDVDLGDISEVKATHIIKVEDIVYPEDMDNLKPEEIREKSKRKGIIVRNLIINGKEKVIEHEFIA
jgi:hypothetical protein